MSGDAVIFAEQCVLAKAMIGIENLAVAGSALVGGDFSDALHARIFETMLALGQDGRRVSMHALQSALPDDEITDGLRLHGYLRRIAVGNMDLLALPMADAVETVRDAARRRVLDDVGARLSGASRNGAVPVRDIARDGIDALDDVMASLRASKRTRTAASGSADAALAYLDEETRANATTGLVDLDRMLGGWPRGQLTIVAGRPGMGKSAFGLATSVRSAKAGFRAMLFSLEMQQVQIGARLLSDLAYTSNTPIFYEDILGKRLDDVGRRRIATARVALDGLPLEIDEQRGLTISEIATRARRLADAEDRHGKLEIVMIDHIGLVRPSSRYAGNRVSEVAEITDGLATMAKELDVAVVGLCQLNRAVEGRENKRPGLSDLRDSGSIEEDASAVLFCYRPAYYLETHRCDDAEAEAIRREELEKQRHRLEIIIAKNRNGRIGTVDAFVDIGANAIRNADYGSFR